VEDDKAEDDTRGQKPTSDESMNSVPFCFILFYVVCRCICSWRICFISLRLSSSLRSLLLVLLLVFAVVAFAFAFPF
jgi:hypothetical protein